MKSQTKLKIIIGLASFVLFLSIGVNIRCFIVIDDTIEGNIELMTKNHQLHTKIQQHLQNKEIEAAQNLLERKIKQSGVILGITSLSKNSDKLQKTNERLMPYRDRNGH